MNLIIGSDLVPTDVNIDMFKNRDVNSLLGDKLNNIWKSTDVRIFNLEAPLVDREEPIEKKGPNLIAPTDTIKGINELNPTLVTLANNHILDHGVQGLDSTVKLLKNNNISFIGAGDNLKEASAPYIIKKDNISVGVYTCAEHEFTIATEKTPGANPFDPLESLDHIVDLKSKCDYVIVLYHGGKEHYRYPSPNLQKICRKMVEKGADLVVCQHSHCIGSYEEYNDSTIVYGQGNFIFNKHDNEFWNTSLLIKVNILDTFEIEYIPILRTDYGVKLATGFDEEEILNEFKIRSEEIKQEGFIEEKYQEFSRKNIVNYLRKFAGYGKWMSRFDRRLFKGALIKKKFQKQNLLAVQNYIECEAHRELLLRGIKGERSSE